MSKDAASSKEAGWKKWGVLAACVLVGLVAIYVTVFRASDEDEIRKVLGQFVKVVAVKADDNVLARMGRIKSGLKEIVDDNVRVDVSELNLDIMGRAKLVEDATRVGLAYQSASCELVGTTIKIDEAGATAQVDTTAIVTGSRGGEQRLDKREVHFLLRKDGGWKIFTVDVSAPQRD